MQISCKLETIMQINCCRTGIAAAMNKVIARLVNKFRIYVANIFISGIIFSSKLVEFALFSILITHLTDEWKDPNLLQKAAIVVNLQEGTCGVLQIFFAFVADAYSGLFTSVICSTTLYIIGLSLSCLAARRNGFLDLGVFYTALVLMTLSQAAVSATLESFFADQLPADNASPSNLSTTKEKEEKKSGITTLIKIARRSGPEVPLALLSVVVSFVLSQIDSLKLLSMVLAIAMGVAFLLFLLGTKFYICPKPTGSPLSDIVFVIRTAISNRNVEYPASPQQLFENSSGPVQILPHVPFLRWLDRAAVMKPGRVCPTVEQVKGVKYFLKMLPMCTTFLTFSVVAATGSTFFLEEALNINEYSPILLFIILQKFTCFVVAKISDYYVLEKLDKNIRQRAILVRIGIGMMCCVLCCVAAWINATQWLQLGKISVVSSLISTNEPRRYMSVYRLIPQYTLLGIMEGLSADGLEDFFDSQVSKSMTRYTEPFREYVMGVGKFASVVCILLFSKWFKRDVNSSHLDKYYAVLAIFSSVDLIIYWLVAYWYGDERFLSENDQVDVEMGDSVEEKGQHKSFSGQRIVPTPAKSSFGDDHPTENTNSHEQTHNATQHVSNSEDGPSDALLLSGVRSFSRPSSSGIYKRFHSIH